MMEKPRQPLPKFVNAPGGWNNNPEPPRAGRTPGGSAPSSGQSGGQPGGQSAGQPGGQRSAYQQRIDQLKIRIAELSLRNMENALRILRSWMKEK